MNIIGASCKHRYVPIKKEVTKVIESLKNDELSSGQSLNQEMSYRRTSDTRWESYYDILIRLIIMFFVIDIHEIFIEDGMDLEQRVETCILLDSMHSSNFASNLHMMRNISRITFMNYQNITMKRTRYCKCLGPS